MTYSPALSSAFNGTRNRSDKLSPQSGMCSLCTEDCATTCEIGLAAVLGMQTVYPTTTGTNQVGLEKDYPIDYSHFNINGRVFGAIGAKPTYEEATIFNVNLEQKFGLKNPVKLAIPVILPALIKLNWEDYFGGAAMAGVCCVIGNMLDSFRKYYRGYGQIIIQTNVEDDMLGVSDYAIKEHGAEAVEIKFGQGSKGTQPAIRINGIEKALAKQGTGNFVYPDPSDPDIADAYEKGICPNFYIYSRLPQWTEEYLVPRIAELRSIGAKNIYFKMAGYDPSDLEKSLRLGIKAGVDMITFDGAGGGSGYSPCKMMNDWAYPTIVMEEVICNIIKKLKAEGLSIPAITVTGGFASEDQVFKALSYGDGDVTAIGICRAAMAAAMSGKKVGEMIKVGNVPKLFKQYGDTIEDIYGDLADLRALYGTEANSFSPGAIGVFSYLNKIAFGLRHFAALNRKFDISYLNKTDLIPLSRNAKDLIYGKWFE